MMPAQSRGAADFSNGSKKSLLGVCAPQITVVAQGSQIPGPLSRPFITHIVRKLDRTTLKFYNRTILRRRKSVEYGTD